MADEASAPAAKPAEREESIFDLFETDESIETMGVLVRYGKKIRILVARAGGANRKFDKLIKDLAKPHRKAINANTVDSSIMEEIMQIAYSKTVVLGWEGVQLERGGPLVEFSVENCKTLFKKIPALWIDLRDFAANYTNFLVDDSDEVIKN